MTRRGKVARLPHDVREELNRRLHNGEPGKPVVKWLNSLSEVQAVLKREFQGMPIREQNLSEWRQGGYRDWLVEEAALSEVRQMVSVKENSGQKVSANDRLGTWVASKYAMAAAHDDETQPNWKHLHQVCHAVSELRREDHAAMRLRLEMERSEQSKSHAEGGG